MKLTTAGQAIFEQIAKEWNDNQRSAVIRKGPASRKLITDGLVMPVENDTMLTLTDAGMALATEMGLLDTALVLTTPEKSAALMDRIKGLRVSVDGATGTVVETRGDLSMVKFDQPLDTRGTTIVVKSSQLVAESVTDMPAPFRTRSKVKNTRQARRYRKGA